MIRGINANGSGRTGLLGPVRLRTAAEHAQGLKRQRHVLQFMLAKAGNARRVLEVLDDAVFPNPILRACFEAFGDLDLPTDPDEPVDLTLLSRRTLEICAERHLDCTSSKLVDLLQLEASPLGSLERAMVRLQEFTNLQTLGDIGAWATREASEVTADPYALAERLSTLIETVRARGEQASENRFMDGSTLTELALRSPEPPPWVLDGVLHYGALGFLAGAPGVGKTYLALQLAAAVAAGNPFFGLTTDVTTVCMVLLETPDWSLLERVNAVGRGPWTDGVNVATQNTLKGSTLNLADPREVTKLIAWTKRLDAGLIVLDPFANLHGMGENEIKDAKAVLAALDRLRIETGAAVLVLHHERKSRSDGKEDSDLDAIRGSTALVGAADAVMRLKKVQNAIALRFPKVRAGRMPEDVWLRRTDSGVLVPGDAPDDPHEAKEGRLDTTRSVLHDAGQWLSSSAIASRVHQAGATVSEHTVRTRYLPELVDAGEVEKTGHGKNTRYRWVGGDSVQGSDAQNPAQNAGKELQ